MPPSTLHQITDNSATEESGDERPPKVKKEEEDPSDWANKATKPVVKREVSEDSESEMSEDISPLGDPAGYSAQLEKRAAKRNGTVSVSSLIRHLSIIKRSR